MVYNLSNGTGKGKSTYEYITRVYIEKPNV